MRHLKNIALLLSLFFFIFCAPLYAQSSLFLHTIEDKRLPINMFHGKWLLIHFWASWCDACIKEIETLNTFYLNNHDDVALFAVNMDQVSPTEQAELSTRYHLAFPSLMQGDTAPFDGGELNAIPAMMIFSPDGTFQSVRYGMQSLKSLATIIQESG